MAEEKDCHYPYVGKAKALIRSNHVQFYQQRIEKFMPSYDRCHNYVR
jgi:hypothetical protein